VALARALVLNPDILLLDEPLSNLDAKIRVQVRAEIRSLQQELRITTIYVTHDQREALSLSDRVAVMRRPRAAGRRAQGALRATRTRFVADFVAPTTRARTGASEAPGSLSWRRRSASAGHRGGCRRRAMRARHPAGERRLDSRPAPSGNVVRGRVAFVSYLGSTVRYDVEATGARSCGPMSRCLAPRPLAIGRDVALSFPASATLALADDV